MSERRMERVLCLDVGDKRIGVAVSDPLGITAQSVETITSRGREKDYAEIAKLAERYHTKRLVIGLPVLMDGSEGEQARKIRAFSEGILKNGYAVHFQDERFSTGRARRVLIEAGVRREKRKDVIDKLAATYILQAFIDSGGLKAPPIKLSKKYCGKDRGNMDGEMEKSNIVELFDEEEQPVKFEHLMTLTHEGDAYVLLVPVDEIEGVDEDEIVIMRIEPGEGEEGEEVYVGIEDEPLLETLFNKYLEIAENDDLEDEAFEDED